jgi:hypothetical protein
VAIDRFTGGAAQGAKYDLEVLTRGQFKTNVEIRNFERWQIGLVALLLRDMEEGLLRIGFGKSRGLGRVKAKVTDFRINYYHHNVTGLTGLAALCSEEECRSYGFFQETKNSASPLPTPRINGLRYEYVITEVWKEVLAPAVNDFLSYIKAVDWPGDLDKYVERKS